MEYNIQTATFFKTHYASNIFQKKTWRRAYQKKGVKSALDFNGYG